MKTSFFGLTHFCHFNNSLYSKFQKNQAELLPNTCSLLDRSSLLDLDQKSTSVRVRSVETDVDFQLNCHNEAIAFVMK